MSRILPDAWCLWATILGLSLGQCFTAQFCLLWTTWSIKEAAMSSLSLVVWGALCCCCLIMPVPSALQPSGLENSTTRGMWHQWWLPLSQSCPVGVCPEYTLSYLFQTAGLDSFDVDILGPTYHDESMAVGLCGLYTTKWQPLNAKDTRISDAPFVFSMAV